MARIYHLPRLLLNSNITLPPSNQIVVSSTSSSANGSQDSNFDSNMVIILAALLCAIVCALGFHSIVRCALRCSTGFPLENSQEGLGSTGLKKDFLRGIPVVAYKKGMNVGVATECAICLADFAEGERVRVLPECDHRFHVKCIDTWLRSHSSCPNCRHLLFHRSATSPHG